MNVHNHGAPATIASNYRPSGKCQLNHTASVVLVTEAVTHGSASGIDKKASGGSALFGEARSSDLGPIWRGGFEFQGLVAPLASTCCHPLYTLSTLNHCRTPGGSLPSAEMESASASLKLYPSTLIMSHQEDVLSIN
ncbi:hypothetical protein J6590_029507 [Homalodisca vitripennis]|nr:hypothetical protein J6590_029507 [Homalodisca vitripennis]